MRRVFVGALVLYWFSFGLTKAASYSFTFEGQITSFNSSLDTPGGQVPLPGPTFSPGEIFTGSAWFNDWVGGFTGFSIAGFQVSDDNNSSGFVSGVLNIRLALASGFTPFLPDPSLNFNPGFMDLFAELSGDLETGTGTFQIAGHEGFSPYPQFLLGGNITDFVEIPEPGTCTLGLLAAGAACFSLRRRRRHP